MASLTFEEITKIIDLGTPEWVKVARKYTRKLQVHINGIGTAEYLDKIVGFENDRQFHLRKKYATSNKFVFENLLRPVDKVFSANGGSVDILTKTEVSKKTIDAKLSSLSGGTPVRKWIQNIQSSKYYSDPSGVTFFEWDADNTKPTLKSIECIRNYKADGRKIDWIIFEPEKRKNPDDEKGGDYPGEFYRVVDDKFDYLIYKIDKDYTIIEEETYVNPWGYVPSFTNSDILDSTLTYHISPIDSVVDLADNYLLSTSTKNIYEFLHSYPIFWAYVEPCRRCDGTGLYDGEKCHMCQGDGHTFTKDVSDIIKLKPPKENGDPKIAPDVAGYVEPSSGTMPEMRTNLDWLWGLMHFTMWGTARQEKAGNETATAAFIDVQPVNDRLNKFTDAFEQSEKLIIDIVGYFYARDNYEGVSDNYGRRYLVEPPDTIWNKYEKAKASGAPKITLDYLLMQYYQSEFRDDIQSMVIATKGVRLEPFIHKTDEEINSLPVMNEDKTAKFYFNEWWKTVNRDDILIKDDKKLKAEFETYLKSKSNGQEV